MTDNTTYKVFDSIRKNTHLNKEQYQEMYARSLFEPETFWSEQATEHLEWFELFDQVSDNDFHKPTINWFTGGKLNVSYNCIDRHLATRSNQTAIIWKAMTRLKVRTLAINNCMTKYVNWQTQCETMASKG